MMQNPYFGKWIERHAELSRLIMNTRKIAIAAVDPVSKALCEEILVKATKYEKDQYSFMDTKDSAPLNVDLIPETLRELLVKEPFSDFRYFIDVGCLVFIHSVLDALVDDLLELSREYAPEEWEPKIQDNRMTVSITDLREKGVDAIISEIVRKHLNEVLRENLANKIELLLSICKPGKSRSGSESIPIIIDQDYKYDSERIKEIDRKRREIIHHKDRFKPISNVVEDLKFLQCTIAYLLSAFAYRYPDQNLFRHEEN
jgi:hypothetical protein